MNLDLPLDDIIAQNKKQKPAKKKSPATSTSQKATGGAIRKKQNKPSGGASPYVRCSFPWSRT